MKTLSLLTVGFLILLAGCQPRESSVPAPAPEPEQQQAPAITPEQPEETPPAPLPVPSPTNSMVGINATNQGYAMVQPWSKENPSYSEGFGIYLGDGNILTAANIVYSASFVEVTSSDGSQTVPVTVTAFDPEANLALLRLKNEKDAAFLDKLVPVTLGKAPKLGDKVEFWQFNADGLPITTSGSILATESSCPFTSGEPFVLYNVKSSVTPLRGGAGNPVMTGKELIGLSASCNPSAQKVLAVTQTMISRFLEQAQSGKYSGFPADGTQVTELTDPVFRKYLGLPENGGGLYVAKLPVYSSFYKAGIRSGDVVESVNGIPLDSKGLIKDPSLGPVSANFLFRDSAKPGDVITLGIRRKDKDGVSRPMTVDVTLDRGALEGDLVNPAPFVAEPRYRIYGGLVFVPLTGALVGEINKLSKNRPPLNLVEAIEKKEEIRKKGVDEIVVFLVALPTQATLGYATMSPSIVEKVDGIQVKNFKHLNQLLDRPAPGGTHRIEVSQQPYTMYMSQQEAAKADRFIQMRAVPVLRRD